MNPNDNSEAAASSTGTADDFGLDAKDFVEDTDLDAADDTPGFDTADTEDSSTPAKKDEPTSTDDDSDDDSSDEDDAAQDEKTSEETQAEDDDAADSDDSDDEDGKKKARNSSENRIRELANENRDYREENRRLRSQIEADTSANYKAATEQELIDEGYDPVEAKVEAMRQSTELEKYKSRVQQINTDVRTESMQMLRDFPQFDPNSDQFDEKSAQEVANLFDQVAHMETDEKTGYITRLDVYPYEFYKTFATQQDAAYQRGLKEGMKRKQKAAAQNEAAVEQPTSVPPKKPSKDAFEQGLDAVWS